MTFGVCRPDGEDTQPPDEGLDDGMAHDAVRRTHAPCDAHTRGPCDEYARCPSEPWLSTRYVRRRRDMRHRLWIPLRGWIPFR